MLYYIGTDSVGLCVIFEGTDFVALYVVLHRYKFYGPVRYIRRYVQIVWACALYSQVRIL